MIRAKHHSVIYPFFKWYTKLLINRNFNSVIIDGNYTDNGHPILVIANHVSWWDGFWVMLLNLKVTRKKFYFMMLEDQLRKHWYFRYTGGFSIKKRDRGIVESIGYVNELLKVGDALVLMFPQGEIHSMYCNQFRFAKGIDRIIEQSDQDVRVMMVVNLIDYFSDSKPNLYIHYKLFSISEFKDKRIEDEYERFYREMVEQQKNKVS